MPEKFLARCYRAVVFIALLISIAACSTPGAGSRGSGGASQRLTNEPRGSQVPPPPVGFVSERNDQLAHTKTGSLDYDEAISARCGGIGIGFNRDHWIASELRYFSDQAKSPSTLTICVTTLASSQDASGQESQIGAIGRERSPTPSPIVAPTPFAIPSLPNGIGESVGPKSDTTYVSFAKGRYFVFIIASGQSSDEATKTLALSLASTEFKLLPR